MAYATYIGDGRHPSAERERVARLIGRYPKVNEAERREILAFLRHGRHLDVGLLTSDWKLRPNLDAFMDQHKAHFRVTLREGLTFVAGVTGFPLVIWLLWHLLG